MPEIWEQPSKFVLQRAKKFLVHQIFDQLGVDLEQGNDTIKICQAAAVGLLRPFCGVQRAAAISRMGDCIVHVEQAETCGAWRAYAA